LKEEVELMDGNLGGNGRWQLIPRQGAASTSVMGVHGTAVMDGVVEKVKFGIAE